MATPSVQTVKYQEKFKDVFRALNLAWIEKYFRVEKKDVEQTDHPEKCLEEGGEIFFVVEEGLAVGTCAMYKVGPAEYELAKMAVHPDVQGRGYGDLLMLEAETWARAQGGREILILSNTVLEPAIRLYKKHGYETVHLGPHPDYERCNIEMKKRL
jgi:GNAT superfamily N-acetyltransferase